MRLGEARARFGEVVVDLQRHPLRCRHVENLLQAHGLRGGDARATQHQVKLLPADAEGAGGFGGAQSVPGHLVAQGLAWLVQGPKKQNPPPVFAADGFKVARAVMVPSDAGDKRRQPVTI